MGQSDINPNIKVTNSYKNKARLFLPPKFSNQTGGVKSVELFPEPLPLHFPRWNGSNNHRKFKIWVCLPNKLRILVVGNIIQTRSWFLCKKSKQLSHSMYIDGDMITHLDRLCGAATCLPACLVSLSLSLVGSWMMCVWLCIGIVRKIRYRVNPSAKQTNAGSHESSLLRAASPAQSVIIRRGSAQAVSAPKSSVNTSN